MPPNEKICSKDIQRPLGSHISLIKTCIPWALLSIRLLIAPLLILQSYTLTDKTILWLYAIAFITDYFDGASARYFKTSTPFLRKADSTADAIFHLALAYLLFRHHPEEFSKSALALILYLVTAAIWYLMDAIRWHRPAGFHAYSAKLFSICLLIWMVVLLGGWHTGHLLSLILIFGALSNIEGISISAILRHDCADMPTIFHALRNRHEPTKAP